MPEHEVVQPDLWLAARKELLAREKELTRLRDELGRLRRELPWEPVEREYVFEGADGRRTLPELFDGRSQLVVYHFMFDPPWDEGCKSCSFWADSFDPNVVHLKARDVTLVAVSRAPYRKRGIDLLNTAYNYLDLVPKGRDEDDPHPQSWVRRHDEYEAAS